MLLVGAPFAHANDDVMRNLDVTYDIAEDGTVKVTWEVDWDFGEPGRRGIVVNYVELEPWEDDPKKDAKYGIENIDVTSPTGAVDEFTEESVTDGDFMLRRVQIGNPDIFLEESRHTYVITYELTGALRTFDGKPEFFWDINSGDDVPIDTATITVNTPGPVTEANCFVGTRDCEGTITENGAVFKASDITGDIFSVGAIMEPGSVDNAEPYLVPAPPERIGKWEALKQRINFPALAAAGALMLALRVRLGYKRRPKDQSSYWSDVPPGETGSDASIKKGRLKGPFAVRFEPPDGMISEVGRAYHGGYKASQLTATLVQMAVEGSLQLQSKPLVVGQGNHKTVHDAAQWELYRIARQPGDPSPMDAEQAAEMTRAMRKVDPTGSRAVTRAIKVHGKQASGAGITMVMIGVYVVFLVLSDMVPPQYSALFSTLAPSIMLGMVIGWLVGIIPGKRLESVQDMPESLTPRGNALMVQAEGFRQYLATAEAGQLNFEADQDIYRRFLPWAVLFDLTARWKRIGQELIEMGRMPAESLYLVDDTSRDLDDTVNEIDEKAREGQRRDRADRAAAQRRRESSSSSYGSGSGGRSSSSSSSSGGSGGGGSSSSSW